jgi:isopenicillin-N N-acyltransferase-like protein
MITPCIPRRGLLLCLSPFLSSSFGLLNSDGIGSFGPPRPTVVSGSSSMASSSSKIRVVEIQGSPFDRGFQHGKACCEDIRRYTEERINLARQKKWSGHDLSREQVIEIADRCIADHEDYAPDLVEELRGMSKATGLSLAELIVVGGFTDFCDTLYNAFPKEEQQQPSDDNRTAIEDDCTAFLIPDQTAADGSGFFGQTWDMHASSLPFVVLLHVKDPDQPEALVFTTCGCLGQIGMNSEGVCIGINNLVAKDGQIGVTWNFVVRKALQQKTAVQALKCVTDAKLAGSHNFLIFDKSGTGFNVEAMSTRYEVTPLKETPISHTNHCLLPQTLKVAQKRPEELQVSSERRLKLADELLQKRPLTIDDLMAVTRKPPICTHSEPPFLTASCGAAIMQPKTGRFWALDGLPDENEYEEFSLPVQKA